MFKRLVTGALVFGMAALAPPAWAQVACADRDTVVGRLTDVFGEKLDALGLQTDQELVEIWTSDRTGTWTILISLADGTSCVVAHGTAWTARLRRPPDTADPSS